MRILTVVALLILFFTNASKAANNGPWCYRDFGGPQYTNCFYYSIRECLTAAGVLGGVCERNHGAAAETPRANPRYNRARPARAHPV
jgi:uncharacterized protein DUF3551